MAYLGNSPVLSQQEYRNIDNISGSFNGVTTSFALLVNGVAPVPAPQSSNQCLISVNGVVQKPDDTGASGFRISGGNIIFSSAPTGGQSFFGVILAGADYIYAGENFPDGTVSAPSITFAQDTDTGFFRSGAGEIKYTANGTAVVTLSSNNLTAPSFIPTSSSAPTNGVYLPAANTVAISTNGTGRLFVDSSGRLGVGESTPSSYDAGGNKLVIADTTNSGITIRGGTSGQGAIYFADGTTGNEAFRGRIEYSHSSDSLNFGTAGTGSKVTLDSSGRLGIGTSSPSQLLHIYQPLTNSQAYQIIENNRSRNAATQYKTTLGAWYTGVGIGADVNRFTIYEDGVGDRLVIDSSGRVGIGTTSPVEKLDVATSSGDSYVRTTNGTVTLYSGISSSFTSGFIGTSTSHPLVLGAANAEKARIDTSGRLLVGTSTARNAGSGSGIDFQVEGAPSPCNIGAIRNSNNAFPARVVIAKTRGGSVGSNTVVQSGDSLGLLEFDGADGTQLIQGAGIEAFVDGTPGTNDMPTRLVFSTTADGASSPTERLRIANNGAWGLAGANYGTSGQVLKSNGSGSAPTWQNDNGKILQVVQTVKTDTFSRTSSSSDYGAITGLSVSITPSSASNKVLIIARVSVGNSADNNRVGIRLTYGGSPITDYQGASAGSRINAAATVQVNGINSQEELTLVYLHSPSTTSSITYGVQGSGEGTSTFYCNRSGSDTDNNTVYRSCSSIMAMEVAP